MSSKINQLKSVIRNHAPENYRDRILGGLEAFNDETAKGILEDSHANELIDRITSDEFVKMGRSERAKLMVDLALAMDLNIDDVEPLDIELIDDLIAAVVVFREEFKGKYIDTLPKGEFESLVATIEDSIEDFEQYELTTEEAIKVDILRTDLAHFYGISGKEGDLEKSNVLMVEVIKKNDLRKLLGAVNVNRQLFLSYPGFDNWFKKSGDNFAFKKRFLSLKDARRRGMVLRLHGHANLEFAKLRAATSTNRLDQDFYAGQVALANNNTLKASEHLLSVRVDLKMGQKTPEAVKMLKDTETLLRQIAIMRGTELVQDLQALNQVRSQRHLANTYNPYIENQIVIVKAMMGHVRGSVVTLKEAHESLKAENRRLAEPTGFGLPKGGGDDWMIDLDTYFELAVSDDPAEYGKKALEFLSELNLDMSDQSIVGQSVGKNYFGNSLLARRVYDRYLKDDLDSVAPSAAKKKELREKAIEMASDDNAQKKAAAQLKLRRDAFVTQADELYEKIKAKDGDMVKLEKEYTTATRQWLAMTAGTSKKGPIKRSLIKRSLGLTVDSLYQDLVRKDMYLALRKKAKAGEFSGSAKIAQLEKAIKMDNLAEDWYRFSDDKLHSYFDIGAELAVMALSLQFVAIPVFSGTIAGLEAAVLPRIGVGAIRHLAARALIFGVSSAAGGGADVGLRTAFKAAMLAAGGDDVSRASDDFVKQWAMSTIMFGGIGAVNSLVHKSALLAVVKEVPVLGKVAYHGLQFATEVVTIKHLQDVAIYGNLIPDMGMTTREQLQHISRDVLVFRAAMAGYSKTPLGRDLAEVTAGARRAAEFEIESAKENKVPAAKIDWGVLGKGTRALNDGVLARLGTLKGAGKVRAVEAWGKFVEFLALHKEVMMLASRTDNNIVMEALNKFLDVALLRGLRNTGDGPEVSGKAETSEKTATLNRFRDIQLEVLGFVMVVMGAMGGRAAVESMRGEPVKPAGIEMTAPAPEKSSAPGMDRVRFEELPSVREDSSVVAVKAEPTEAREYSDPTIFETPQEVFFAAIENPASPAVAIAQSIYDAVDDDYREYVRVIPSENIEEVMPTVIVNVEGLRNDLGVETAGKAMEKLGLKEAAPENDLLGILIEMELLTPEQAREHGDEILKLSKDYKTALDQYLVDGNMVAFSKAQASMESAVLAFPGMGELAIYAVMLLALLGTVAFVLKPFIRVLQGLGLIATLGKWGGKLVGLIPGTAGLIGGWQKKRLDKWLEEHNERSIGEVDDVLDIKADPLLVEIKGNTGSRVEGVKKLLDSVLKRIDSKNLSSIVEFLKSILVLKFWHDAKGEINTRLAELGGKAKELKGFDESATTIAEIKAELTRLKSEGAQELDLAPRYKEVLGALKEAIGKIISDLQAVNFTDLAVARERLRSLRGRLQALEGDLHGMPREVQERITESLNKLRGRLEVFVESLKGFDAKDSTALDGTMTSEVQSKVSDIAETLQARQRELSEQIGDQKMEAKRLERAAANGPTNIARIDGEIRRLDSEKSRLRLDGTDPVSEIGTLEGKVTAAEASLRDVSGNPAEARRLTDEIASLRDKIAKYERLDDFNRRIEELGVEKGQINESVAMADRAQMLLSALKAELTRLNEVISSSSDALGAIDGISLGEHTKATGAIVKALTALRKLSGKLGALEAGTGKALVDTLSEATGALVGIKDAFATNFKPSDRSALRDRLEGEVVEGVERLKGGVNKRANDLSDREIQLGKDLALVKEYLGELEKYSSSFTALGVLFTRGIDSFVETKIASIERLGEPGLVSSKKQEVEQSISKLASFLNSTAGNALFTIIDRLSNTPESTDYRSLMVEGVFDLKNLERPKKFAEEKLREFNERFKIAQDAALDSPEVRGLSPEINMDYIAARRILELHADALQAYKRNLTTFASKHGSGVVGGTANLVKKGANVIGGERVNLLTDPRELFSNAIRERFLEGDTVNMAGAIEAITGIKDVNVDAYGKSLGLSHDAPLVAKGLSRVRALALAVAVAGGLGGAGYGIYKAAKGTKDAVEDIFTPEPVDPPGPSGAKEGGKTDKAPASQFDGVTGLKEVKD
jgi:hypothetical protein